MEKVVLAVLLLLLCWGACSAPPDFQRGDSTGMERRLDEAIKEAEVTIALLSKWSEQNTIPDLILALKMCRPIPVGEAVIDPFVSVRAFAAHALGGEATAVREYRAWLGPEKNKKVLIALHEWWHQNRYYFYFASGLRRFDAEAASRRVPTQFVDVEEFKIARFLLPKLGERFGREVEWPLDPECEFQAGTSASRKRYTVLYEHPDAEEVRRWWKGVRDRVEWDPNSQDFVIR